MIDPLEAVINYLAADSELAVLVGERVAAKHRYGKEWQTSQPALTVLLDGGTPELYVPMQTVRLETRSYATTQAGAMRGWRRLMEISRHTQRAVSPTSQGAALLFWFTQASGPSLLFDRELGLDFVLGFFEAAVGEAAL